MKKSDQLVAARVAASLKNNSVSGVTSKAPIVEKAIEFGKSSGWAHRVILTPERRVGWGKYDLSELVSDSEPAQESPPASEPKQPTTMAMVQSAHSVKEQSYVPEIDSLFVRWGPFKDIEQIAASKQFCPVLVSGLSGNGKTFQVEQAAAKTKRKYIRVQINPETDEDDLIGGFRLIDGNTVFAKGPVIRAMEEGALLLLDEIDRGSNKLMCLQSVLEGKSVLLKKTGETVFPAQGFNVIATANTKGRGSDDGRFTAATIIDDAFLERFAATIEQPWPTKSVEKRIVLRHMESYDCGDENFADLLVRWAGVIRKTFEDEGVEEVISTRRLCHVAKCFGIFNDRRKAIKMAISRFDSDTAEAFSDLYDKIDSGEISDEEASEVENEEANAS